MGSNNEANKGMHYSDSPEFWGSKYDMVRDALADDVTALNRFDAVTTDLEHFKVCWIMSGGSADRIIQAFRYLVSMEAERASRMEEIKETKPRRGSGCSIPFRLVNPYTGEVLEQYGELDDGAYWGSTNSYGK